MIGVQARDIGFLPCPLAPANGRQGMSAWHSPYVNLHWINISCPYKVEAPNTLSTYLAFDEGVVKARGNDEHEAECSHIGVAMDSNDLHRRRGRRGIGQNVILDYCQGIERFCMRADDSGRALHSSGDQQHSLVHEYDAANHSALSQGISAGNSGRWGHPHHQ